MAVYRQQRRVNPLAVIGILLLISVVIGTIAYFATRSPATAADNANVTRSKAMEAAQGLDILTVEYPQASEGAEYNGIKSDIARAKSSFEAAQDALKQIDAAKTDQIAKDLATLQSKIDAKAPTNEVVSLAQQIETNILALVKLLPGK